MEKIIAIIKAGLISGLIISLGSIANYKWFYKYPGTWGDRFMISAGTSVNAQYGLSIGDFIIFTGILVFFFLIGRLSVEQDLNNLFKNELKKRGEK